MEEEGGIHNKGMTKEDEGDDEEDESEETLTPGDLMAFAWQISEGMVRPLLCCVTIFKHYIPCRERRVAKPKPNSQL